MVAHSPHPRAIVAGHYFDFYRQFRHRLGALSVFVIHVRAALHSRRLGVLQLVCLLHLLLHLLRLAPMSVKEGGFFSQILVGLTRVSGDALRLAEK